jgi:heterodisulfide reductase subunit C
MAAHFSQEIMTRARQNINACYQCKKCAAGCPVSEIMQYQNYQLLRLIQRNRQDAVLKANTAWVCVGCKTCSACCPNGIDIARVMDAVKEAALTSGAVIPERRVAAFNAAFLEPVRQFGRSFELGLFAIYKMKTGTLFQDAMLGLRFIRRNKLGLLPHGIKRIGEVRRIFARMRENRS